jgi:hypothetical protein
VDTTCELTLLEVGSRNGRKPLKDYNAEDWRRAVQRGADHQDAVMAALIHACVVDRNPLAIKVFLDRMWGPVPRELNVQSQQVRRVELVLVGVEPRQQQLEQRSVIGGAMVEVGGTSGTEVAGVLAGHPHPQFSPPETEAGD